MKTKTSILALTKAFFILLVSGCLFSCETTVSKKSMNEQYFGSPIEILTIDSCEYIYIGNDTRSLTHKGNCKFCKQRSLNNR